MDKNWNMIGHEWAVEMLKEQLGRDSIRHAYLFTGPPGVGRRTLALRFIQTLNCSQPAGPAEPCGECKNCVQIEKNAYPDLVTVQAEKEGGTVKVDPVRELRLKFSLMPYQSRYRVGLFLRFHEANPSAANALLKTLEEAPAHAILILTADHAGQLLPTVQSRCEILRLRPLPLEMVESFLLARGAVPDTARLLAHVSGGRPGYALSLMEDKASLEFRSTRLAEMQMLLKAPHHERFAYAGKLTDRKKKNAETEGRVRETLQVWLSFWRDVLLRASSSTTPLANIDQVDAVETLAARLSLAEARRLVQEAEGALEKLSNNVNARLLAEVTLLDWPKL